MSTWDISTLPEGLTCRNLPAERLVMSTSLNVINVFAKDIQFPNLVYYNTLFIRLGG